MPACFGTVFLKGGELRLPYIDETHSAAVGGEQCRIELALNGAEQGESFLVVAAHRHTLRKADGRALFGGAVAVGTCNADGMLRIADGGIVVKSVVFFPQLLCIRILVFRGGYPVEKGIVGYAFFACCNIVLPIDDRCVQLKENR